MTDDELRIKVAGLCGWAEDKEAWSLDYHGRFWSRGGIIARESRLPDYPNSLDAMHEAEATLTKEQQDQYIDNLLRLVVIPFEAEYGVQLNDTDTTWTILHANAQQRARAFVETFSR